MTYRKKWNAPDRITQHGGNKINVNGNAGVFSENSTTRLIDAYHQSLTEIPLPGTGCHTALLSVANRGIIAGADPTTVINDIEHHIPPGQRTVPRREIEEAVKKAVTDRGNWTPSCYTYSAQAPGKGQPRIDGRKLFEAFRAKGAGFGEPDYHDLSPVRLPTPNTPGDLSLDTPYLLRSLYAPDESVFIGGCNDGKANVRTVAEWLRYFDAGNERPELIMPNPLSGRPGQTHDGKSSYRCDAAVASMRYAVMEFDNVSIDEQYEFWAGFSLPIVAVIHSGGKSLHIWLRVDCPDYETWQREVKGRLYGQYFKPMGVDGACANPARMSRLPGVVRQDAGNWQRLCYLAPKGEPLS